MSGDKHVKLGPEMLAFNRFMRARQLEFDPTSIRKGVPGKEPSICCTLADGFHVGYELTESCALEPIGARLAIRLDEVAGASPAGAACEDTVLKNLQKRYDVAYPVELVVSVDETALSDDLVAEKLEPIVLSRQGPFRRIWLLGAHELLELGAGLLALPSSHTNQLS